MLIYLFTYVFLLGNYTSFMCGCGSAKFVQNYGFFHYLVFPPFLFEKVEHSAFLNVLLFCCALLLWKHTAEIS